MPRKPTLKVQVINIAGLEHSAEFYRELLQDAYRLKLPIRTHGQSYMVLQSLGLKYIEGSDDYIMGTIARFTEIDMDGKWFDVEEFNEASEDDLGDIKIPENLRPNLKTYYFLLDLRAHKFVYEAYGEEGALSARQVEKFLTQLFSQKAIRGKHGDVQVNIVSDQLAVKQIFALPIIKRVKITINRPNPDDLGDLERQIEERLKNTNSKSFTEEFVAMPSQSIDPDEEMRALAVVSTVNGETNVKGRNDLGVSQDVSTKEFPAALGVQYDPDESSPIVAFKKASAGILG